MNKYLIVFLIVISSNIYVLKGQVNASKLIQFSADSCDNTYINPYKIKNRILSLKYETDTIFLKIRTSGNCCSKFTGEIERKSDSILNLKYTETNDICACHCGFSLHYKIWTNEPDNFIQFELNGNLIEMTTKNQFDHFESSYHENGKINSRKFYEDGKLKAEISFDTLGVKIDSTKRFNY